MTILAVSGPIGSNLKAFSEKCYSFLNQEKALLIDSTNYKSIDLLLAALAKSPETDVIVYGAEIFFEEKLKPDIKVFLALDPSICLSRYLTQFKANQSNLEGLLNYYFETIKPLNDKIKLQAKLANFICPPQAISEDIIIDLIVDKDGGMLRVPQKNHSNKAFLQLESDQQDSVEISNQNLMI